MLLDDSITSVAEESDASQHARRCLRLCPTTLTRHDDLITLCGHLLEGTDYAWHQIQRPLALRSVQQFLGVEHVTVFDVHPRAQRLLARQLLPIQPIPHHRCHRFLQRLVGIGRRRGRRR